MTLKHGCCAGTENVLVSNAPPPSGKHFVRADSSLKVRQAQYNNHRHEVLRMVSNQHYGCNSCAILIHSWKMVLNVLQIGSSSSGVVSAPRMKGQAPDISSGKLLRRLIGSSTPECGHTCGACSPCKIQVVSYECTEALEPHAEACPLGYLCICHGRSFPIP